MFDKLARHMSAIAWTRFMSGMPTLLAYTKITIIFNICKKNYKKDNINTIFNLCENVFNDV